MAKGHWFVKELTKKSFEHVVHLKEDDVATKRKYHVALAGAFVASVALES
jgi:hypothetical protein